MNLKNHSLKICILANAKSGKNKYVRQGFHRRFIKIVQDVEKKGTNHQIFFETSHSLEDIVRAGRKFKKLNADIIAIFGGDGTIQKSLTRLCQAYGKKNLPPILLLRGGTMNLVGRSMKLKGSPEKRLKLFLENANSDNLVLTRRKTLDINGEIGFIFGLALACNFIDLYNDGGDASPWKAIKMIAKTFWAGFFKGETRERLFAPLKCSVSIDGKKLPFEKITSLLAQTIPNLVFCFNITFRALEKEGTCHAVVSNAPPIVLFLRLFHVLFKISFQTPRIFNDLVSEIKVLPEEKYKYMLDGEIFLQNKAGMELTLKMGPAIHFAWYL